MITGLSKLGSVRLASSASDTATRKIALKDLRLFFLSYFFYWLGVLLFVLLPSKFVPLCSVAMR